MFVEEFYTQTPFFFILSSECRLLIVLERSGLSGERAVSRCCPILLLAYPCSAVAVCCFVLVGDCASRAFSAGRTCSANSTGNASSASSSACSASTACSSTCSAYSASSVRPHSYPPTHPCLGQSSSVCSKQFTDLHLTKRLNHWCSAPALQYNFCTGCLKTRGGIWLQSQRPSAQVYGDYSLIIAINSSFSVNNRTRSAAECHPH